MTMMRHNDHDIKEKTEITGFVHTQQQINDERSHILIINTKVGETEEGGREV